MGPVGPAGEAGPNGQKGDMGPAGLPGSKGEPSESISVPTVAVSPARLTANETRSASFQCSVNGNPKPTVVWSKLNSQTKINQSAVLGDTLRLQNLKGSDAGVYKCSAVNILGQAHAVGHLIVNGELLFFFAFFIDYYYSYCKDLLCAPYKMNDEERYYVATLQKNAGTKSRCCWFSHDFTKIQT